MKIRLLLGLPVALWLLSSAASAQSIDRQVSFAPGTTAREIRGTLRGNTDATYRLRTGSGQVLQVLFSPSNRSCYFNAFAPGQEGAVHIGSSAGNEFGQSATIAGEYRFQIYLMRNAARRNETCRYRISFEVTGAVGGVSPGTSDRMMRDQCQSRVADMYAVPQPRVRMGALRRAANGLRLDGTVDKGAEGIKKFRCLFTPARQLRDVMAMTPDGE